MEDSTSSAAPSASLLHRPSIKARSLSLTHNPLPSFSITASEDFPPADVGAERKKSVKSRPKRLSVSSLFTTGNSPMTAPVISPAHSFSSLLTAGRGFSFLSLTRRSSWSVSSPSGCFPLQDFVLLDGPTHCCSDDDPCRASRPPPFFFLPHTAGMCDD